MRRLGARVAAYLVYKHVYKRQQEGPFLDRKRPLTCTFGSGGRI